VTTVAVQRRDGTVLCERCVVAEATFRRMRGLLGRSGLEEGDGLLLRPAPAIQTWFMRFPIDAVFLDRDLTVVMVREHMRPFKTAGDRRARSVLELAAGEVRRHGVEVGERLRVVWPDEQLETRAAIATANGNGRQIRVALATPDARFLRVATFLLERHGYGVQAGRKPSDVLELVGRGGADVALIDGTGSLAAAARMARAIEGLDPGVGVIVLSERDGSDAPRHLPVVEKWSSFDSIIARIESLAHSPAAGVG